MATPSLCINDTDTEAISSAGQPTPEQLSQLRSLVAQMSGTVAAEPGEVGPFARVLR